MDFTFAVPVAGIAADHIGYDFEALCPADTLEHGDIHAIVGRIRNTPPATSNRKGTGSGDPVNLVVIGDMKRTTGSP